MVNRITDVQATIRCSCDTGRAIERSVGRQSTIAIKCSCSVTRYRGDDAIRAYPANSMVSAITDIQAAVRSKCGTVRVIK